MRAAALLARARAADVIIELAGDQLAVSAGLTPPPDLLAAIRTHKPAIVEYLRDDHMPAGAGVCPVCAEVRWLRAGPTSTPCDDCALADDPAEVCARGELP